MVSLHPLLDKTTYHLINEERLSVMKDDAILVNAARGPVVDEVALVAHLQANPNFRCGLDVFEDEPLMKPGESHAIPIPSPSHPRSLAEILDLTHLSLFFVLLSWDA